MGNHGEPGLSDHETRAPLPTKTDIHVPNICNRSIPSSNEAATYYIIGMRTIGPVLTSSSMLEFLYQENPDATG